MDFAYVTFVNNKPQYLELLQSTLKSVQIFSKYSIIVYLIDVPEEVVVKYFPNTTRVVFRHIKDSLPNIYFYKPYIILDAINKGLKTGYYVEADDVLTPHADNNLFNRAQKLLNFPICPIHPSDPTPHQYMKVLKVSKKTQHYVHGHVLFRDTNKHFIGEWLASCLMYIGENYDESALNCMFWKYGLTNHYMEMIDYHYTHFYGRPESREKTYTYHACKDGVMQHKLLNDMIAYYQKKKVITYCLWGNNRKYTIGAIKNAVQAQKYYPDFECWFYVHEPSVPSYIIKTLQNMSNCRVILRGGEIKPNYFMSWRFEPQDDPSVELFVSRDTDSRLLKREVLAVGEWVNSDKLLHIMRDSPCHYPTVLGGMFGLRKIPGFNMIQSINEYFSKHPTNDDQMFLKKVVYPLVKHSAMIHDEIKKYEGKKCRNFPVKWDRDFHFIGEYRFEDDSQDPYYRKIQQQYVLRNLPDRVCTDLYIKYALVASDLNREYLDFYPLVKKCWKTYVGVYTKLVLISKFIPEYLEEYKNDIILFPPLKGIHTAFQAQCIRLLYPALMDVDGGVIISDMDLVPVNESYYKDCLEGKSQDKFIVYRNCISHEKEYPICFCLANPKVWKSIFDIESKQDIRNKLKEWYTTDYSVSNAESSGWAMDQKKLYHFLQNWEQEPILLTDDQTGYKRLDRLDLKEIEKDPQKYRIKVMMGEYSDFHMPRPYGQYKNLINTILL